MSVTVGISLGSLWGIVTGYYGGTADNLSQRVVDTLMAFPPLILALGLMAVLSSPSITSLSPWRFYSFPLRHVRCARPPSA